MRTRELNDYIVMAKAVARMTFAMVYLWDNSRQLYGYLPIEHSTCEQCDYLPICMGQCPQSYMESGYTLTCVYKNGERSMKDRIIDLYESSLKQKQS